MSETIGRLDANGNSDSSSNSSTNLQKSNDVEIEVTTNGEPPTNLNAIRPSISHVGHDSNLVAVGVGKVAVFGERLANGKPTANFFSLTNGRSGKRQSKNFTSFGYATLSRRLPRGTSTSPTDSSTIVSGPAAVRQVLHQLHAHQSVYFPNLPVAPVNGMIKTYSTEHRTFTRPHSAKTVFFYKDNDTYYTGLRVPISKAKYRTIGSLLDTLNERIELPFGVRHLHTPYGRTPIKTLDQLEHLGRYVASSTRRGKGLDMDAMERKKREREVSFRYRNVNSIDRTTTDWSGGSNRSFKARLTRVLTNRNTTTQQPYGTHFTPTTAKQIYFVLNGRPSHIYRCLLNPARPLDLETILEEVSQGLGVAIFKIYTYDGERITGMDQLLELKDNRVLAVPRHERLMLQGRAYADAEQFQSSTTGLPPIRRFRESSRSSSGNIPYSTRRYHAQTQGNSIEKPRRPYLPPTAATLPQQTTRQRYVSSLVAGKQKSTVDEVPTISNEAASSSSIPRKESQSRAANFPQLQNAEPTTTTVTTSKSTAQWKAKRGLTNSKDVINKRANAKTWNQTTTTIAATVASGGAVLVGNTLQSSTNTADSDSGRPRSSNDFSNGHTTAVPLDEFDEEDAIEDDDEDPDSEVEGDDEMEAANHEFEDDDDYPEQPYGIAEEAVEQDVERSEANLLALREEREDRELSMIKPGSASDNEAIKRSALNATAAVVLQNIAATKIQARARGFLVRRRAQRQQEEPVEQTIPVEPPETTTNQNEAAAKIQAGVRGFLTRQRLKRRVSDNELTRVKEEEQQERASAPSRTSDRQSIKESRPVSVTSKRSERDIEDELNSEENKKDDLESTLIEQTDDVDEIVRELAEEQQIDRIEDAAELAPESEVLKDEVEAEGPTEIAAQLQAELPVNLNDAESTVHGGESEVDDAISENKLTTAPKLVTNDTDADHDVCSGSDEDEDDVLAKRTQGPEKVDSYSVTVKLGNRWAADSETELYITMIGERKESEKFYMRHKYVNWLESEQTNYVQQSSDTFQMQVECGFLGIIRKLIVGHDTVGYGAGIFIDRIIITEDAVNGRAFLFQCLKWFDSGQVDGKLERTLRLSAYYDMDPIPHAMQRVTCGRWEVVLHNGDSKGVGGTTSNLRLVGFGTRGSDTVELANEKELREVPSKTLMQCHFNGIGELLKLRVEIDGSGDEPDYFLEQVELRDLDTQDRCVLPCSRWLKWSSTKKGEQPFREFLTFRLGTEPLPLITYDGKLRITPPKFECVEPKVRLELVGDMGESGFIWIDLNDAVEKNGKLDLSFKVEAVSIGKLNIARLFLQPNEIGEQIYEGFAVLQDVWDARNDETTRLTPLGTTGNDWLVGFLYVREGAHTPYRYVLNSSIIRPRSGPEDPYVKELRRSALEGTSTRVSKKKALEYRTPTWLLSMSLTAESKLLPLVYLCGMKDTAQMDVISATPTDNLLSFRLKEADLGDLCKVRVKADKRAILGEQNIRSVDEQKQSAASNPKAPTFHIKKMRLSDSVNGDEIRFPSADVEMEDGEVVEFPAFWPDRPPLPNLVYEVRVSTGASNLESNAPIRLNIFGEFGDISYRKLDSVVNKPEKPIFSADSKCTFEFEAVSIGVPTTAEITVECEQNEFLWECTELVLTGSLSGQSYVFNFSRAFTAQNNRQNASVSTMDGKSMEAEKSSVVAKLQVPNSSDGSISAPATPHSLNSNTRTLTVTPQSRKRRATDEMAVDLPQMLKLVRSNGTDPKTPLERLEKQICCRFDYKPLGWNEFRIDMFGTDVGLRKGHDMLTRMIKKPPISDSTGIFSFMSLPLEVQCMIVNQVDWKQPDGRPLLPLRLVSQHFRTLVDRVMEKGRRCFKKRICLAETTNAKVRLGFPPLVTDVSISFEQLDSLLLKITSDSSNSKNKTQIFLICEWRSDWCKRVMELLLKHDHIKPSVLHIKGVICDENPFKNYVNARPSLQRLVFEKPVGRKHVFNGVQYLPYHSIVFKDLGRQFDSPESVRKGFTIMYDFKRKLHGNGDLVFNFKF